MITDREYHYSAVETLRDLSKKGVKLDVNHGKINYEIPPSLPTDDVLGQIRFVRPHLLELFSDYYDDAEPDA